MGAGVSKTASIAKNAVLGAIAGAVLTFRHRSIGPSQKSGSKVSHLNKQTVLDKDKVVIACAAVSGWVYDHGKDMVKLHEANGCRETAYRFNPDPKESVRDYIPDETMVPLLEENVRGTDETEDWCKIRYHGTNVYVRKKHVIKGTLVDRHSCLDEVQQLFEQKGLPVNLLKEANFIPGGSFLPSLASVLIKEPDQDDKVLIIAWQGTQVADRPMDIFTDAAAAPVRSGLWFKMSPHIWAHGAIHAKVESDFLAYKENVLGMIREHKMEADHKGNHRIVFTGHSLGGGAALIAHMGALGVLDEMKGIEKRKYDRIEVHSVCFAAPMVFYVPEGHEAEVKVKEIKEIFQSSSINYVCDKDIVPRLPGHYKFFKPAIKAAVRSGALEAVNRAVSMGLEAVASGTELVIDGLARMFLDQRSLKDTVVKLQAYSHFSRVDYYKFADEEEPWQLIRNDAAQLAVDEFVEEGDDPDDFEYLLACHSFFPDNIKLEEATSASSSS